MAGANVCSQMVCQLAVHQLSKLIPLKLVLQTSQQDRKRSFM